MIHQDHHYRNKKPVKVLTKEQYKYIDKYNNDFDEFIFEYVKCECNSTNDYTLSYRDKYSLRCNTVICLDCGLVRINPRMNKVSLNKFYEEYYRSIYAGHEYATDAFFEEQYQRALERIYAFSKMFLKGDEVVLEIGCGAGGIVKAFIDQGFNAEGCDIGGKYLAYGKNKGLNLHHCSAQELLQQNKKYDFIIISNVLEHMSDLSEELQTVHSLLNENGKVYIDLPGILNIKKSHTRLLNVLQNAHNYNFSLKTLTKTLGSFGFELIKGDEVIKSIFIKTDILVPYIADKKHALVVLNYVEESEKNTLGRKLYKEFKRNVEKLIIDNFPKLFTLLQSFRNKTKTTSA